MPVYNCAHLIPETIKAIENQTHEDFECLIVGDGGNDNTSGIIKSLNLDKRFTYQMRPSKYPKGPSGCRNFALDQARGDYVIFFDDDDIPHPQNLANCLEEINTNGVDFCRYNRDVFYNEFHYNFDQSINSTKFKISGHEGVYNLLSQKWPFNNCAVMWRKKCFISLRYDTDLVYAEEWELFQRILVNGFTGISIDKTLFYARKHIESSTGRSSSKDSIQFKSIKLACLKVIDNLCEHNYLNDELVKFFAWESVRHKDKSIFRKLMECQNISNRQRLIANRTFYLSPLIKLKIRFLKRFK
jgi:glycosyltransferase involved in cell wall biosynthesis